MSNKLALPISLYETDFCVSANEQAKVNQDDPYLGSPWPEAQLEHKRSEKFEAPEGKVPTKSRLHFELFQNIKVNHLDDCLVQNFLNRKTMSVIFGDSNSGKTFFAMDMGLHRGSSESETTKTRKFSTAFQFIG